MHQRRIGGKGMNEQMKINFVEATVDKLWVRRNFVVRLFLKMLGKPTTREEMIKYLLQEKEK